MKPAVSPADAFAVLIVHPQEHYRLARLTGYGANVQLCNVLDRMGFTDQESPSLGNGLVSADPLSRLSARSSWPNGASWLRRPSASPMQRKNRPTQRRVGSEY